LSYEMSTVTTSITGSIVRVLVKDEAEFDQVAEAAGIVPIDLHDPEARVPFETHSLIWGELTRRRSDPYVGLKAATAVRIDQLGVAAMSIARCSTLGEAIHRFLRYQRLLNDAIRSSFSIEGSRARIKMELKSPPWTLPRSEAEFALGFFWSAVRAVLREDVVPTETRFIHARPPEIQQYEPIFGKAVEFGARSNEIVFSGELLERSSAFADPVELDRLGAMSRSMLENLPAADPFVDSVRRAVFELLGLGELSVRSVSRKLGVSAPTLRRELKNRRISLRLLVNAMKRDLAMSYLEDPSWSLSDIAFVLDFSETSAFNRTFRGWTGVSPADYRRIFLEG